MNLFRKQFTNLANRRFDVFSHQRFMDFQPRLSPSFRVGFAGAKAGFPRFKGQNRYDSFCYPQKGFILENDKLELSKIGQVKLHLSRPIVGKVKTCTIKRELSGWFVIFTVETEKEILPKTGKQVGIDAGIESFMTLSDGTQIENNK